MMTRREYLKLSLTAGAALAVGSPADVGTEIVATADGDHLRPARKVGVVELHLFAEGVVVGEGIAAVDRLIDSGRADGEVRDDVDVPTARRILIGTLEEVELAWLLGPRTRPLTPQAEPITRILLRGVATTGDGG